MSTLVDEDKLPRSVDRPVERGRSLSDYLPAVQEKVWPAVALVVAIGLALRGQQLAPQREYPLDGPLYFAVAIWLFLWGVGRLGGVQRLEQIALPWPDAWPAPGSLVTNTEARWWFAGIATLSTVLAYLGFAGNRFTTIGVTAWLAAIGFFLLAVAERPATDWRERVTGWLCTGSWSMRLTWVGIALLGITLVAIFYRTYRLTGVPAEMTSDHAEKLLDVHDVLNGLRPIFFVRNTGREALQFYLTAGLIKFTPLTLGHLALKVGTALFGILTVPLTYLLGRQLYNRDVGLLAAAVLAISQWHVAITRVGLRFPFTAAFAVPTLYFLFRAFKYNRRNDWLACGLVLGAGLHSYTTLRVVPLLLVALVGVKVLFDLASRWRGQVVPTLDDTAGETEATSLSVRFWENALLGGIVSGLVFLPLLRYMRDEPDMFWFRVLSRASDVERRTPADLWSVFWGNVKDALLMFNVRGDTVWVNTVPGSPALNLVAGGLFVLGIAYVLWRFVQRGDRRSIYVLIALFGLLLPSILSLSYPEENPSVVRAGGAVPIAALLAALPLYVTVDGLRRVFGGAGRWMAAGLLAVLFIVGVRATYQWYFVEYDQQFRRSAWNTTEMGEVVRGFTDSVGDMQHAYHVAYPYWADTRNIAINAGDITWRNAILDIQQAQAHVNDPAPKLYLLHVDDQQSLSVLQSLFPEGRVTHYQSATPTKDFLVFFVPARPQ